MPGRFVALMRAIAHTPMSPFRGAMAELGFADIASVGMSGNLIFTSSEIESAEFERQIGTRFGTTTCTRTTAEIARVADRYPFRNQAGACVMFLSTRPDASKVRALKKTGFEGDRPLLSGREVFFHTPSYARGEKHTRTLNVWSVFRGPHGRFRSSARFVVEWTLESP